MSTTDREILKRALRGQDVDVIYGYIETVHCDNPYTVSYNPQSQKTTVTFITYNDEAFGLLNQADSYGVPATWALVKADKK